VVIHLSEREKVAQEAEQDLEGLKKAELMRERTGEIFHGLITGVQSYGLFVEIEELLVEDWFTSVLSKMTGTSTDRVSKPLWGARTASSTVWAIALRFRSRAWTTTVSKSTCWQSAAAAKPPKTCLKIWLRKTAATQTLLKSREDLMSEDETDEQITSEAEFDELPE
jgi:hypothetical protein